MISFVLLGIVTISFTMNKSGPSSSPAVPNQTHTAQQPPIENNAQIVTLTADIAMSDADFSILQSFNKQFMNSHPFIRVILKQMPVFEADNAGVAEDVSTSSTDIYYINNYSAARLAGLGKLQPLDNELTSEQWTELDTPLVQQLTWDGYTWGVPNNVDPYVMVWNQTALQKAGIQQLPESSKELLAVNDQLRKMTGQGIYMDVRDEYALLSVLWGLGANTEELFTVPVLQPLSVKQKMNDSPLQAFFTQSADTKQSKDTTHTVPKTMPAIGAADRLPAEMWNQLRAGKLAGAVVKLSSWELESAGTVHSPLVISSLPNRGGAKEKTRGTWLNGESFSVSADSEHLKQASVWIRYMVFSQFPIALWKENGIRPAVLDDYNLLQDDSLDPEQMLKIINHGNVLPIHPWLQDRLSKFQNEWMKTVNGRQSLQEFSRNMHISWKLQTPASSTNKAPTENRSKPKDTKGKTGSAGAEASVKINQALNSNQLQR